MENLEQVSAGLQMELLEKFLREKNIKEKTPEEIFRGIFSNIHGDNPEVIIKNIPE